MTTDVTPIAGDTWDDIDHTIYDLRIRQHKSLRGVALEINMSHEHVRRRLGQMMRKVTHAEVDEMRTSEGHRLDELADQNRRIVEAAITVGNIEAAQSGLREIHRLTRTRAQLFGLDTVTHTDTPDAELLEQLFGAYLTGRADAKTTP